MRVSAVMGCVTKFTADVEKIRALRVTAVNNNNQQPINQQLKTTPDAVFTKFEKVTLWGGLQAAEPSNISAKGLTSALQFSDTALLAATDGLVSVLLFLDAKICAPCRR